MTRSLLLLSAALAVLAAPSYAQDKKAAAPEKPAKESVVKAQAAPQKDTPITKWIAAENALIDPLGNKDKESFFILRNKHSIIRVIRVVERDIGSAVKSCAKNNPEIKDSINARFKQWQGAVNPILDTAQKQLNKDIDKQTLVPSKDAKRVLKMNDEAFEYGEKQITKTPITTLEACGDLVKSMDRTEDEMIGLLQETLLTESVIRQRADKAEKQTAKDKSFSRATKKAAPEKAPEPEKATEPPEEAKPKKQ